jgi:outer membrane protein TolC
VKRRPPAAFAIALLVICAPPAAAAQTLDLGATVRYALAHDASLLAKRANLANLEAAFVKQHASEFPTIGGLLQNQMAKSANSQGQFAQFGITPQSNFSQNTAQVTAQWAIFNGSLNQVLTQEDRRQVESARNDLSFAEDHVAADVSAAFYDLDVKRETVRLDEGNRIYEQQLLDAARANERVGRGAGVDTLRAQVAETRAEAALVSARADDANAREALASRIGAPLDVAFDVPATLPEPAPPQTPVAQLVGIALAARTDVAAALATLRAAQLANAAIDTDLRPQIALNGAFGNQTSPTQFVALQQQIDAQNAAAIAQYQLLRQIAPPGVIIPPPTILPSVTRGTPGFWQIGATATLAVPLIDYGTRRAAHRAATAQIDSDVGALSNVRSAVELDVRQSLRAVQTNATNLRLAKQAAELARESARIAALQYRNGLISFTDANATEQTSLSAQTDLASARVAYVVSLIRLRIALGTSDPLAAALLQGS